MSKINIGVVWMTKVGKRKFIKNINSEFDSKPNALHHTKAVGYYSCPKDNYGFLDFPGFDDSRSTVIDHINTNIHLIDMCIIILDSQRLVIQNTYLKQFLSKDIPTIIFCNRCDITPNARPMFHVCIMFIFISKIKIYVYV